MTLLRRRQKTFDLQVHDFTLRITAGPDLVEESRAAALTFWEQLQSYSLRDPEFRTSKRPLPIPEDAPEMLREIVTSSAAAGVGPMFAFRGAVTDYVGRLLARQTAELTVECSGDIFLLRKKKTKVTAHRGRNGHPVSVVVVPRPGGVGVSTTIGRARQGAASPDGLAVLASSCMLADAAAAGVQALLSKRDGLRAALQYLEAVPGVQGGIVILGERIGVAGAVEIAS